jgi:tetratricopeptide (TPR) repeat protein
LELLNNEEFARYGLHARYGIHVNRAVMRSQRGSLLPAIEDLKKAIDLDKNQFAAYENLAQAYRKQAQQLLEARNLFTVMPGQFSSVLAALTHCEWRLLMDAAERQLDKAIVLKDDMAALYNARAQLRLERQELKAALEDIDQAIRINRSGDSAQAENYTAKGRIHYQRREYLEAVYACVLALQLRPRHPEALLLRARAWLLLKDYEEADDSYTAYLDSGAAADAGIFRARAFARAGRGDFARAIADGEEALRIEPNDSGMHAFCGWQYLTLRDGERALWYFERTLQLNPKNGAAHNGRGLSLLLVSEKYRPAVAEARKALELGPLDQRMLYIAARIYAQAAIRADTLARRENYQDEAVRLVLQALAATRLEERRAFWEDYVKKDPALAPILPRLEREVRK